MAETSTKPYMIRAIYEWCCDNGYTPYLAVKVDGRTLVPVQHVRNGEIVLNISPLATNAMQLGNDLIEFQARFNGVPEYLSVPVGNVLAIYARETGSGMAFSAEPEDEAGFEEEAAQPAASPAGAPTAGSEPASTPSAGGAVLAFARPAKRGEAGDARTRDGAATPASASPAEPEGGAGASPSGSAGVEAGGRGAAGESAGAEKPARKGRRSSKGAVKAPVADAPQADASQATPATAQPEKAADTPRVGQNTGIGPDGGDEPPPAGGGRPRLVRVK